MRSPSVWAFSLGQPFDLRACSAATPAADQAGLLVVHRSQMSTALGPDLTCRGRQTCSQRYLCAGRPAGVQLRLDVQGLADPHAKVRWASCQALGQMCTDLGPKIQAAEHARILPALQRTMENFREPRVQSHAAAALVNFAEDCEEVGRWEAL